jgi:Cft2 family RNA processing exonuclease
MTKSPKPKVTAISGVRSRGPACFLIETGDKRLLLDLGYGPDPGVLPDLDSVGPVDALILSHGHRDHAGGLQLLPKVSNPPIYATEIVAERLQGQPTVRLLPLRGHGDVLGVSIATGRNGHAPGGIWIRFALGKGLIYMGDYSTESLLYEADGPPPAGAIIIDASNGDDDTPLARQAAELDAILDGNCVLLPVPADGRGPEIALHIARRGDLDLRLDPAMRSSLRRMIDREGASLRAGVVAELERIVETAGTIDGPRGVMLATPADGTRGETARYIAQWEDSTEPMFVFTGYVPPGTPAAHLVTVGRAKFLRWNVHPRISDNVNLVRSVGATIVIPAFCDQSYFSALSKALAPAAVIADSPLAL